MSIPKLCGNKILLGVLATSKRSIPSTSNVFTNHHHQFFRSSNLITLASSSSNTTARQFNTAARLRPLANLKGKSPEFRSSSSTPPPTIKSKKGLKTLIGVVGLGLIIAGYDKFFLADSIQRTLRTAVYGSIMAADFKLNFNPENVEEINALHERVAWRIHHICVTNSSMYIKLAQSIALQASILPKPYRDALANVFDQAPVVGFVEVVKIFKAEFGVHPDEAFESFDPVPAASASIAQVHKARLRRKEGEPAWGPEEGWVAVKVRKPNVPIQIEWDLFAYRTLLYCYEKMFDLPVYFVSQYVSMQMRKEIDLLHEAKNAQRAADLLALEPGLRDQVMIPKIHFEWTGASIMTADYITACKLTDKAGLEARGLSVKEVMDNATALFAAQTFKWGFLHSDPHPGNVLVRNHPKYAGKSQIVLLDHGLYIELPEKFRQDYSLLWRSLFIADIPTIQRIALSWGIAKENTDLFSSMMLLRPHGKRPKPVPVIGADGVEIYEKPLSLKDRLKSMLENEQMIPRELIFLTRAFRMMQANNQTLGSPTNRINILAAWANIGLETNNSLLAKRHQSLFQLGVRSYVVDRAQSLLFKFSMTIVDIGFKFNQLRQWVLENWMGSKNGEGFEDVLQRQVTEMARAEFGVELGEEAFKG